MAKRQYILAIHHHDKTGFLAREEFLDHHARDFFFRKARTGIAQFITRKIILGKHHVDRGECLVFRHRDHHTLAGSQTVGLDHDGRVMLLDIVLRQLGVAECLEKSGGDVVAHHETLGEILGGFELRSRPGRAENLQSCLAERIHDARRQRRFRADHGHVDVFALRKSDQPGNFSDGDILHAFFQRRAGISRRDIHFLHFGALRKPPGHRVFASA